MKYKVILFDADGTLFDFEKTEKHALEKLFAQYSFKEDSAYLIQKYKEINEQLWKDLEHGKLTSGELKIERFRRLFNECGLNDDFCKISSSYVEFLSEGTHLLEGAEDICKDLSTKYVLAVVTNGIKEVQYSRVGKSAINKYIKHLIVSEEAGSQKPAKEIFEYSLSKIGHTDRNSVIIVGDSLSSDIQGGINFGIDTCWLNPQKIKNETGIIPTYEIFELNELRKILY